MATSSKGDPQGGSRTVGRHVSELSGGAALALLLVSFIPESWGFDPFQLNLSSVVLTGALSTVAKLNQEAGFIKKLLRIGLVAGLLGSIGCAGVIGKVDPQIHTGSDGETIVACSVTGVAWSGGDADICRNLESGHVGRDFVEMVLGIGRLAAAAVGGILGGIGGAGAALSAATAAPTLTPQVETVPAITQPVDAVTEQPAASGDWFQ